VVGVVVELVEVLVVLVAAALEVIIQPQQVELLTRVVAAVEFTIPQVETAAQAALASSS
jgi:hypothetical protein